MTAFGLRASFAQGFTEAEREQADAALIDPSVESGVWLLSYPPTLVVRLTAEASFDDAEALAGSLRAVPHVREVTVSAGPTVSR